MVEHHIAARGVRSALVLKAMGTVPREEFLPAHLREYAYEDTPLPIGEAQTISQPYIVAFMVEALGLSGGEKVLEIGAGSGYAAAILSRIAGEVFTVERIGELAAKASEKLADLGYDNVHVLHADGTLGWPEHAPYDAIIVAAGGPEVPRSLKQQLKVGGRMVIPVGRDPRAQELVRVTRVERERLQDGGHRRRALRAAARRGRLGGRGAAPAAGARGALPRRDRNTRRRTRPQSSRSARSTSPTWTRSLRRIGKARVVLIGEATHGTSEFYRMREKITRALIDEEGIRLRRDRGRLAGRSAHRPLRPPLRVCALGMDRVCALSDLDVAQRRGEELCRLAARAQCAERAETRVAFHGLDLYSLHNSIRSVLDYLDDVDPAAAKSHASATAA